MDGGATAKDEKKHRSVGFGKRGTRAERNKELQTIGAFMENES